VEPEPYTMARDYLLPDFERHSSGRVVDPNGQEPAGSGAAGHASGNAPQEQQQQHEAERSRADAQVLRVTTERIAVPELLFRPIDIGLNQAGLAEVVMQSLEGLPASLQSLLLANVLVSE
jgi:actin-related protein